MNIGEAGHVSVVLDWLSHISLWEARPGGPADDDLALALAALGARAGAALQVEVDGASTAQRLLRGHAYGHADLRTPAPST